MWKKAIQSIVVSILILMALATTGCPAVTVSPVVVPPTPAPTYSVTYDGNGSTSGAVPIDSAKYSQGQTVAVLGNSGTLLLAGS